MRKGDPREVVIGPMIKKRTMQPVKWIGEQLKLGLTANASLLLRRPLNETEQKLQIDFMLLFS